MRRDLAVGDSGTGGKGGGDGGMEGPKSEIGDIDSTGLFARTLGKVKV